MISGDQVRNARFLLDWTVRELARKANIGMFTVDQIENLERPNQYPGLPAIRATLEAEGIKFLAGDTATSQKADLIETVTENLDAFIAIRSSQPGTRCRKL
jgi:transcriptional regulator with XRE-family HTH domain